MTTEALAGWRVVVLPAETAVQDDALLAWILENWRSGWRAEGGCRNDQRQTEQQAEELEATKPKIRHFASSVWMFI
ncbi:MAG TPA: hypothetical protein VHQ90_10705 [Thermoanaerobaculia bacterium]|nr:hypothetical protein [Thermoanaerobaculia bacterium]